MPVLSDLNDNFKKHGYSVVTAVVVALLIGGYIAFVLPQNIKVEDKVNAQYLGTIEKQFKNYIDDRVNEVGGSFPASKGRFNINDVYVSHIEVDSICKVIRTNQTMVLNRTVFFKKADGSTIGKDSTLTEQKLIDFREFLKRVDASTSFDSFFMCMVSKNQKCDTDLTLMSKNISAGDRDSISTYFKRNGALDFKGSPYRYYTTQAVVPNTNRSVIIAVGVDKADFDKNVHGIRSGLVIFSLMIAIMLLLSINFIKPVISSSKERVSQMDLMTAIFSIGTLTGVLIVFGLLAYWNAAIHQRNEKDLKNLAGFINESFTNQIDRLVYFRDNAAFKKIPGREGRYYRFTRDTLSSPDGNNFTADPPTLAIHRKDVGIKDFDDLKYLDTYFQVDNDGNYTDFINKDELVYRKKVFSDRSFYNKFKHCENYKMLNGILSREKDRYQWIFSEIDDYPEGRPVLKKGIKGIAFRQSFTHDLDLSPDTDYMIIDNWGNVLMHKDSTKNLYQNLAVEYEHIIKPRMKSAATGSFEMEYQGKSRQVYLEKLKYPLNYPVYILAVRDLSHMHYLSVFTFINAILITVGYGFFLLLLTLAYSAWFYKGKIAVFSWTHFHYLFPDNSRAEEYFLLKWVNIGVIAAVVIILLLMSPSAALICGTVLGINCALFNFIVLNIRPGKNWTPSHLGIFIILIGIILPLVFVYFNLIIIAFIILFGSHIGILKYYRSWRRDFKLKVEDLAAQKNRGVARKAYSACLTAILFNFFAAFPLVLVSVLYASEIGDYARYYCSSITPGGQHRIHDIGTFAYGCDCESKIVQPHVICKDNDCIVGQIGFLEHPTYAELKKFDFKTLSQKYYINSEILYKEHFPQLFLLLLSILLLVFLIRALVDYYANRFFYYDLMQAAHQGYYPCTTHSLASTALFVPMIDENDVNDYIQTKVPGVNPPVCTNRNIAIEKIFHPDAVTGTSAPDTNVAKNEIPIELQLEFISNHNRNLYDSEYLKAFLDLSEDERKVLIDFAPDNFVNYKNKEILMQLMDKGIVVADKLTGRLKIMSPGFGNYIIALKMKGAEPVDAFLAKIEDDNKNGTYSKLRLPILIIGTSLLMLIMYLKRDSFDQMVLVGGSVGAILGTINRLMSLSKTP